MLSNRAIQSWQTQYNSCPTTWPRPPLYCYNYRGPQGTVRGSEVWVHCYPKAVVSKQGRIRAHGECKDALIQKKIIRLDAVTQCSQYNSGNIRETCSVTERRWLPCLRPWKWICCHKQKYHSMSFFYPLYIFFCVQAQMGRKLHERNTEFIINKEELKK